ncbi:MAG TPA: hypothetical protein PKN29_04335 [Candidatus Ozemobacteraceae bacterium]|nr:hypothetical protein [Candidatus Ozemobacteraceae bacterium]
MNEAEMNGETPAGSVTVLSEKAYGKRWLTGWLVMLCDVILFASALNCLFRWLSYGYNFDLAALVLSLLLALAVYFTAMNPQRIASLSARALVAVGAVVAWAVLMPVVMRLAGFS